MGRRTKAQISAEFHKRNTLELDNAQAKRNMTAYLKYHDAHTLRRNVCNKAYDKGHTVSKGRVALDSKDMLEAARWQKEKKVPKRSVQGESTDYDTEGDDYIKEVLATLPPLAQKPKPPAKSSGAGPQQSPTPPPPQVEQAPLGRKALHTMPPPSVAGPAKQSADPIRAVLQVAQTNLDRQKARQEKLDAERPGTAPPGIASAKSRVGTPSLEELKTVQEVLDQTASLVPAESLTVRVITPPG